VRLSLMGEALSCRDLRAGSSRARTASSGEFRALVFDLSQFADARVHGAELLTILAL